MPVPCRLAVALPRPALAVACFLSAACGGGGAAGPTAPPPGGEAALAGLRLNGAPPLMLVGETFQLVATPVDGSGKALPGLPPPSYASSDEAAVTVDASGLMTAGAPGSAVVTATLTVGGVTKTATSGTTVAARPAGNVVTTPGTSFNPDSLTVAPGDTVTWQFSGAVHNVTFRATRPDGGDIGDQVAGAVVTRTFSAAGTYGYECTNHVGMTGVVVVESGEPAVFTSVEVSPATPALDVGDSVQLAAVALDRFGLAMAGAPAAVFASGDPAVVTVSPSGLARGVAGGTVTVSASITLNGVTRRDSAVVTVSVPQQGVVTVNTPNRTFDPVSVTVPAGGTVTWRFSEAVHNVTFQGAAPEGGSIPDQDPGNAVSRTFATPGTYSYDCTRHSGMVGEVIVEAAGGDPVYTDLAVTPDAAVVGVGGTVRLVATPLDQNGLPMPALPAAAFASGDAGIATVDGDGLVTGVGEGAVTVTASVSYQGDTHFAEAAITVVAGAVFTVTASDDGFTPGVVEAPIGATVAWAFTESVHNVTFDAERPPEGDVPDTAPGASVARRFPAEGTFDYTCTIHDHRGRVRVR